jgi:hypothetical protein
MIPEIKPHHSQWETLKNEAMQFSPQVKQALITVCGAFLLSAIAGIGGCIGTHSENSRLRSEVDKHKTAVVAKDAEISRLSIELTPFRSLAVQEFNRADTESMRKLAEAMTTLRKDYASSLETLNSNRVEIEQLRVQLRPKPFPQRLLACLDSIDPRIKQGLSVGTNRFKGVLKPYQLTELQKLAAEGDAAKYISLKTESALAFMQDGTGTPVEFILNPELLKSER